MYPSYSLATVVCVLSLLFGYGQSILTCSGGCNCSRLASGKVTAKCVINSLEDLDTFIPRPQDVKILKLKVTGTQVEEKVLVRAHFSSLETLDVSGNKNWTIPKGILTLPKLKEIRGFFAGEGCTSCTLVRNYTGEMAFASITYVEDKGYKFQNVCTEQEVTLHNQYQSLVNNRFFPKCIMNDTKCQGEFGTSEISNRCIKMGAPILLGCVFVGVAAIAANSAVLGVILKTHKLRQKPAMILICSLAVSDILVASYVVSLGVVYQLLNEENFQSRLNRVCPYLGFVAVSGFAFTAFSSLLITTQRYLVVVHSLKRQLHMRVKSTLRYIVMAAITTVLLATWAFLTPRVFQGRETCIPVYGPETKLSSAFGLTNVTICVLFYALTFGLYAKIYIAVRNSGRNLGIRGREMRLMKKIGLIVVTNFVLGLSPFIITNVGIYVVSHGRHDYHEAWIMLGLYVPLLCAAMNALFDPVIYAYRNTQFKQTVVQKWRNVRRTREQQIGLRKRPCDHDKVTHKC